MRRYTRSVHVHAVGCCIILSASRQLSFFESLAMIVVSQSTHHYYLLTKRTYRVVKTAKKGSEHGADYALCWVHDGAEFESSLIKCSVSFVTSSVVFLTKVGSI